MGFTYQDILKAQKESKFTPIKGKDYIEVNQRIIILKKVDPAAQIITEMLSNDGETCVFKASIISEGVVLGTGTAFECKASSFINKTSYIENCETSAVGRALAMCGIGIDTSVASFEEVANAIENQNKPADKKVEAVSEQMEVIKMLKGKSDAYKQSVLGHYKVSKIEDLSAEQCADFIQSIKAKENK